MNIKLTLGERLKDLRVERHLKLETLAEQTGLSNRRCRNTCAGWAKTVNCHAHPRILLPQNRCLPEPFAAPFPHQPEPRCNTLDFASKKCAKGCAKETPINCAARPGQCPALKQAAQEKRPSRNI